MKSKLFVVLSLFLVLFSLFACGNKENQNDPVDPPSVEPDVYMGSLTFLEDGKGRVDIFGLDVNVSYGNQAIANSNTTITISDSALFSVNKNTTETDTYYFVFFAEKNNGSYANVQTFNEITGNNLLDFFDTIKDEIKGYTRAYVSISKGQLNWTKGLSTKMDSKIQSALEAQ